METKFIFSLPRFRYEEGHYIEDPQGPIVRYADVMAAELSRSATADRCLPEKTDQALSDKARLGVTEAEWNWAMERVFAMQANGSKAGAAILLIEAVRERDAAAMTMPKSIVNAFFGKERAAWEHGFNTGCRMMREALRSRSSATKDGL